ncbi:recombinase family protein [Brucella haematophila]|nr:recombinase family protein [Brucella haematophila]TMV04462.1 recombinase family protein [Brucella haematophila]
MSKFADEFDLPPLPQARIGYARPSMEDPFNATQLSRLQNAGCIRIYQEHAAEKFQSRPALEKLLSHLVTGDTLVVLKLDRVVRSVSHLAVLIRDLTDRGIHLLSLDDPLDTSGQASALQILDVVVNLEHALKVERTRAGMKLARARGKLAGNPGLRERRPEAISNIVAARNRAYMEQLVATAPTWLPTVSQLRPQHSWENIVLTLNLRGQNWTVERLRRAIRKLVQEGLAEPKLLTQAKRRIPDDYFIKRVAAIAIADPTLSLRAIAAKLDAMGAKPPRGGGKWQAASIRNLLEDARRFGFIRN